MDPLASIDVQGDTSFALMLEAQARGHRVLHADPADLAVDAGRAIARVRPAAVRRVPGATTLGQATIGRRRRRSVLSGTARRRGYAT
jgi:glutathione synthase